MYKKNITVKETFELGVKNHQKKNFETAGNLYKEILKTNPNHFGSIFYLGSLLVQTKRFNSAKSLLQKAIQIKTNYAPAYSNLGGALKELGEYEEAIEHCQKAIQIDPNYADAYNNLGASLKELGELQKAVDSYQKAIQIQPNFEDAHINLSAVFQQMGDIHEAIKCYQKLNQIQSNLGNAYSNLGGLYVVLGDTQKAASSYQNALKYEPDNLVFYYHLIDLNKEILNLNLKNKIARIINDSNCTKKNLAYGNFLLSKYAQKEKNYKKEFDNLIKGHQYYFETQEEKHKKQLKYWLNELPNIKELFDFNKSKKEIKKINHKIKPIFIVGVPRCGSTLVEKIIASGVNYIPTGEETAIISSFVNRKLLKKQSLNFEIENFRIKLYEMYKQKRLIQEDNDFTFTDKTLDNFFYTGFIKEIFPHAKVINCKRSAIASIISILQNNLPDVPWAHNLEHIFKYFDIYYRTIEKYKRIFPNFIYELELEKLVKDPENESKKLMKFCDLPWDKKCLEFYKRKDLISRTTSNLQIRKPIYKHSEKKYLPYKQFLKEYGDKYSWYN